MRTWRTMLALFGAVALAIGVAAFAHAQAGGGMPHQMGQGGRGMGPMQGEGPMAMLAQLNLTDQQKQDVHKLMMDAQPEIQANMEQMRQLHEQLKAQVFADAGPTGSESATAKQVSDLQAKMIQAHVALADKLSAILTADQRKQVREMPMDAVMGMMGMGMMHGPGRGGPPDKK